jgi:hypothetical protein
MYRALSIGQPGPVDADLVAVVLSEMNPRIRHCPDHARRV